MNSRRRDPRELRGALGDQDAASRRGGRQGPFRHGQGATPKPQCLLIEV
jgi:hypothetical protein